VPQPRGGELELRQLFPERRRVTVAELLGSVDLPLKPGRERPYTVANFVASADGRATFQGRSGKLGDDAGDRALFHGLREIADAVLVGTGTLRAERYGRLTRDPERRARRTDAGLAPEPLCAIVTRSGELPVGIPLFEEPESRIVVFSPTDFDPGGCAADVQTVRLDPGELTLTTALRRLRSEYDIRLLLCEGGPTLFSALLHEALVDELFLTLAPKLTGGGGGPAVTNGPELAEPATLALQWLLEHNGSLFLRYTLQRTFV
jgi:riboflavin biosynthesis pyrimidine reductase